MNVALGVASPEDNVITSLDELGADDEVIVISGTANSGRRNMPEWETASEECKGYFIHAAKDGHGIPEL